MVLTERPHDALGQDRFRHILFFAGVGLFDASRPYRTDERVYPGNYFKRRLYRFGETKVGRFFPLDILSFLVYGDNVFIRDSGLVIRERGAA